MATSSFSKNFVITRNDAEKLKTVVETPTIKIKGFQSKLVKLSDVLKKGK